MKNNIWHIYRLPFLFPLMVRSFATKVCQDALTKRLAGCCQSTQDSEIVCGLSPYTSDLTKLHQEKLHKAIQIQRLQKTKCSDRLISITMWRDGTIREFLLQQSNCFKRTVTRHTILKSKRNVKIILRYRSPLTVRAPPPTYIFKEKRTDHSYSSESKPHSRAKRIIFLFNFYFSISSYGSLLNQK